MKTTTVKVPLRRTFCALGVASSMLVIAACGSAAGTSAPATNPTSTTSASTTPIATTTTPVDPTTTITTTTTSTTTTSTTSAPPTTTEAPALPASAPVVEEIVEEIDEAAEAEDEAVRFDQTVDLNAVPTLLLGRSVEDRPIIARRHGTPGGRRVLVIGVIHGNEDAGLQIVDALTNGDVPEGVELWLIDSMNPDGVVRQDRHNANEVDLNRNFPYKWGPIGQPGNSQYAGTGPASEPETQAMVNFIAALRPDIAIWYHQDANLIIPSTGRDGRIRARYAELTALPLAECCGGGGIYTGIAATWARIELKQTSDAVPFIVELPGGVLSPEQVAAHTNAVLTIAVEG